jgi:hypothetical protein
MLNVGNGQSIYYVVAEAVHMGIHTINIHITDNEVWAKNKSNKIIGKVKANTINEAKEYFRIIDMIS